MKDMWNLFPRDRSATLRTLACAAGLIAAGSVGYYVYHSLCAIQDHISEETILDHETKFIPGAAVVEGPQEDLDVLQVTTSGWHVLPTEPVLEASAIAEKTEECWSPEEKEVPLISHHLAESEVTDVALKLHTIREAFSTVFACAHVQNFMFVAGKKLLKHMTAANKQDVAGIQQVYDSLIRFLRGRSNQDSIKTELLKVQVYHLNFLDVLYELIVFRYFVKDSAPVVESEGGFLEHLSVLVRTWDITSWEPAAQLFFRLLIDHLFALLRDLFSQPLNLYSEPAALSSVVRGLLKQHIQLMLEAMRNI